jgi:hypothetical protein
MKKYSIGDKVTFQRSHSPLKARDTREYTVERVEDVPSHMRSGTGHHQWIEIDGGQHYSGKWFDETL